MRKEDVFIVVVGSLEVLRQIEEEDLKYSRYQVDVLCQQQRKVRELAFFLQNCELGVGTKKRSLFLP
jgi:hypothetical protein